MRAAPLANEQLTRNDQVSGSSPLVGSCTPPPNFMRTHEILCWITCFKTCRDGVVDHRLLSVCRIVDIGEKTS